MSKNKSPKAGIVYSTDPSFRLNNEEHTEESLVPALQKLKVMLDKKNRAGKAVTLVAGFVGPQPEAEELGKKLKSFCGTGGSVKDGEIIVQGDNRDKIITWLLKNGYSQSKKIG